MDELTFCGLCLKTNVKLHNISFWIIETYSELLQEHLLAEQQKVCYMCLHMLHKFKNFQEQCYTVHQILTTLQAKCGDLQLINEYYIPKIDRNKHKLGPTLNNSPVVLISNVKSAEDCSDALQTSNATDSQNNLIHINIDNAFSLKTDSSNTDDYDTSEETNKNQETTTKRKTKTKNLTDAEKSSEKKIQKQTINQSVTKKNSKNNENVSDKSTLSIGLEKNRDLEDHFTILDLTSDDARAEMLRKKEQSMKSIAHIPYVCKYCYVGYTSKAKLDTHMKRHSLECGEYVCEICHSNFPTRRRILDHYIFLHTLKFNCKSCSYTCSNRTRAKAHLWTHSGKQFQCGECKKLLRDKDSLARHMTYVHKMGGYVCDLCGATLSIKSGVTVHKRLFHKNEVNEGKGPKCYDCDVQFSSELAYKRHMVLFPRHGVSNGCKICGETLPTAEALKSHKLDAHGIVSKPVVSLPAACSICGEWLRRHQEYNDHMISLHPDTEEGKTLKQFRSGKPKRYKKGSQAALKKKFVCEQCGNAYKFIGRLLNHQRVHTGEKPFSCDLCGRSFSCKFRLGTHLDRHKNVRPYKCPACPKTFVDQKCQKEHHQKIHLGLRPRKHRCEYCEKLFQSKTELRDHVKYVHLQERRPKRKKTQLKKRMAEDSHDSNSE